MKVLVTLSVMLAVSLAHPEELYSAKYDDFDVDSLINNQRLLKSYAECLHGKGPCTAEGKELKAYVPEAVSTACKKCTPKQKILVRKMVLAIKEKLPEEWETLQNTFDPKREHAEAFGKFLVEEN